MTTALGVRSRTAAIVIALAAVACNDGAEAVKREGACFRQKMLVQAAAAMQDAAATVPATPVRTGGHSNVKGAISPVPGGARNARKNPEASASVATMHTVRERVPWATVIAMVLITLVCLGQMALAVLQNRPAHAIGLAPLLVAGGVVLVRGARSRRSDGPVVRS